MGWRSMFNSAFGRTSRIFTADAKYDGSEHHPIIEKAIKNQHEIELFYQKNDSFPERRVIIPTEMAPGAQDVMYLRGFDVTKQGGHKTFRTDRIIPNGIIDVRDRSQDPGVDPDPLELSTPSTQQINRTLNTEAPALVTSDQVIKKPDPIDGTINNPVEIYQRLGKYRPKSGDIDPTKEEYEELRSLDIDPDTHDKATIRRLRNQGISHEQLKSVASDHQIPFEDYEHALQFTGDHDSAVQRALSYRNNDEYQLQQNAGRNQAMPGFADSALLTDEQHKKGVQALFLHHLNLKNAESFMEQGPIYNEPDRRRANEWIMSELSKVAPGLKKSMNIDTPAAVKAKGLEWLQGNTARRTDGTQNINYFEVVNALSKHHEALQATATDFPAFVKQRRILKALTNVGNARFYPENYNGNVYEE